MSGCRYDSWLVGCRLWWLFMQVLNGIVNRLRDTIPSTPEGLEDFKEVVVMTTTFQKKLTSLGFADDTSGKLVDYVNNVNMLFAEKKCQEILRAARSLMMSDVCKTVLVRLLYKDYHYCSTWVCLSTCKHTVSDYVNWVPRVPYGNETVL